MIDIPYYDEHHNRLMAEEVIQSVDLGSETVYYAVNPYAEPGNFNITSDMIGKKILYSMSGMSNINVHFKNTTGVALAVLHQFDNGGFDINIVNSDANYSFFTSSSSKEGVIVFYRYESLTAV